MDVHDTPFMGLQRGLEVYQQKGRAEHRLADPCGRAALAVPLRLKATEQLAVQFALLANSPPSKKQNPKKNQVPV
jgi:hypothetical protein